MSSFMVLGHPERIDSRLQTAVLGNPELPSPMSSRLRGTRAVKAFETGLGIGLSHSGYLFPDNDTIVARAISNDPIHGSVVLGVFDRSMPANTAKYWLNADLWTGTGKKTKTEDIPKMDGLYLSSPNQIPEEHLMCKEAPRIRRHMSQLAARLGHRFIDRFVPGVADKELTKIVDSTITKAVETAITTELSVEDKTQLSREARRVSLGGIKSFDEFALESNRLFRRADVSVSEPEKKRFTRAWTKSLVEEGILPETARPPP